LRPTVDRGELTEYLAFGDVAKDDLAAVDRKSMT